MWVYKRTRQVVALVKMPCPVCNTEATFQILKRRTKAWYIIIPRFSTSYFTICGNCHTVFRITKQAAEEAERASKNETDAEYNIRVCPECSSFNSKNQKLCGICGASCILNP